MVTSGVQDQAGVSKSMREGPPPRHGRLPDPRWLVAATSALVLWAAGLLVWWASLQSNANGPASAVVKQPTHLPRETAVAPVASSTASALVLSPVERAAGPIVESSDWQSLANEFRADRASEDIAELARERYAGRATGSPGGRLAAEWIAGSFARYGLLPAGDDGTYYQEFPVPYAELTATPTLDLLDGAGKTHTSFRLRGDYALWPGGYADGGQAEAPVLWMGDGSATEYRQIEAEGNIVLCRWQATLSGLQRQALEHGAKALLVYRPDYNLLMRRTAREEAILPVGIPTLIVGDSVVKALLENSGLSLADLPLEHSPRPLPWRMRLDIPLEYDLAATGRNVLGVLPGSDPDGIYQTVIVGAHYDHLGADPDGTLWGGANDDASGVAVMLELARVWQEQGYVPKRTVLFAAWDAEEIGLNGSKYYVEHPRLPLTSTIGMLQLDMVGAGKPTLLIEPRGLVADQSFATAAVLGIRTFEATGGGSDHVPFAAARVPATLYIWDYQSAPPIPYHVPADDASLIDQSRLMDAGRLAGLVLTILATDDEELEDLESALQTALDRKDEQAFLSLVSTESVQWRSQIAGWFERLRSDPTVTLTLHSDVPLVAGDVATSTTTLQYRWAGASSPSTAQFTARWSKESGQWRAQGPALATASAGSTVVVSLGAQEAETTALIAESLRQRIQRELGLAVPDSLTINLYGSAAALNALERPPSTTSNLSGWADGSRVVLARTTALTETLLSLALTSAGWSPGQSAWLSFALAERWSGGAEDPLSNEERFLPVLLQAHRDGALWSPDAMPLPAALPTGRQAAWEAQSWAMLGYVLEKQSLNRPGTDLSGWRQEVLGPWLAAEEGISSTLAARVSAVMTQDEAAFLATVDGANATLLQEERHWFADLKLHPVDSFSLTAQLLSLQGESARARLTLRYQLTVTGAEPTSATWIARFVNRGGVWLYSDLDFAETASTHLVLKHDPTLDPDTAQSLLGLAETGYASVVADLQVFPPLPVELKLYSDPAVFRTSIYLSMGQARGWNEPGEAIKLTNLTTAEPGPIIAHELTHVLLFQLGVQHAGVHEGTAQWEAALVFPRWKYTRLRRWRQTVYDTIRSGRSIGLANMANWSDWLTESELVYNVGWDSIDYLRRRFGREEFLSWLRCQGSDAGYSPCFSNTLQIASETFDQDWRQSVLLGHMPAEWITMAQSFDGAMGMSHVAQLAQAGWAGRQTATAGNSASIDYVASAFVSAGLLPLGDDASYLQPFKVDVTRLAAAPTISYSVQSATGAARRVVTLTHQVDFREVVGGAAGGGSVSAGLVYAPTLPPGVSLVGRVLLTDAGPDLQQVARQAKGQGAVALLIKSALRAGDMAQRSAIVQPPETTAIPVLELTEAAAQDLLKAAGQPVPQAGQEPTAYVLPISVTLSISLDRLNDATTANVVGYLLGSDARLANEFVVIGAQLDGVGSVPGGALYPAANHDASGVAVLLEIARLWHDSGYRPRRSVIFAVWNAGELGQLGSRHWLQSAVVNAEQIRAVVHLDSVGQGRGYYLDAAGDDTQDAVLLAGLDNAARQVEGRMNMLKYRPLGDDATFHNRRIPTVSLSWERPEFADTAEDVRELVDPAKLQATGRLVALTLMTLADE